MKHTVLPFVVSAVLTVRSTAQESTPLKNNDDGSLTIYVQAEEPKDAEQRPKPPPLVPTCPFEDEEDKSETIAESGGFAH